MYKTLDPQLPLQFWNYTLDDYDEEEREISIFDLQDVLEQLGESCRSFAAPRIKLESKRPKESFANPRLRIVIFALHFAIVLIGRGELAVWESPKGKTKGSLVTALEILRRHIPEFIPQALPSYATLRRIIRDAPVHSYDRVQELFKNHQ